MKRLFACCLVSVLLLAAISLALSASVWPAPEGSIMASDGKLTLDLSGSENGYFLAMAEAADKPYKLRVEHDGTKLTYLVSTPGDYEVFPLQLGSGDYTVSLYQNTSGKKYSPVGTVTFTASLAREDAAFLAPNQLVMYAQDSPAVALSEEICAGKNSERERFEAIRSYVQTHFVYDYVRYASEFTEGSDALPRVDRCAEEGKGVYQDLAAMTACMLRAQGIPTRFVTGYVDKQLHAWNVLFLDGQEILYDPSVDLNAVLPGGSYAAEREY